MADPTLDDRIRARADRFSKGQQRLARFLSDQGSTSALMTASDLAEAVGVSEATVVRFSQALGYSGYPEMRRDMQALLRSDVTTLSRFSTTVESDAGDSIAGSLVRDVVQIQKTVTSLDDAQFSSAVDAIVNAKQIWTVGALMSYPAAHLLRTGLRMIGLEAQALDGAVGTSALELHAGSDEDVLISIGLRRYNAGTVSTVDLAKSLGITRIGITDDILSPIATRSDIALIVAPTDEEFFQSTASLTSVATALVTQCSLRQPESARRHLTALEERWADSQTFVDQ